MKIVVIGNAGQLSYELVRILGEDTICLGPEDTDITKFEVLAETLSQLAPDVIINAAAYTAVDKAEEAKIVKKAARAAAKQAEESKPTLGDTNAKLQEIKDKMEGKGQ